MADYAKLLRQGVKTANKLTESLQPQVTLRQWIGQDLFGKVSLASAKTFKAIVVQEPKLHKTSMGQYVQVQAYVAFLQPIPPNNVAGRVNPIDPRDQITLPDGTTGPIVDVKGFVDAGTNKPMFSEVWIGSGNSGGIST